MLEEGNGVPRLIRTPRRPHRRVLIFAPFPGRDLGFDALEAVLDLFTKESTGDD